MPRTDGSLEIRQGYLTIAAMLRVAHHAKALDHAVMAGRDEAHTPRCLARLLHWPQNSIALHLENSYVTKTNIKKQDTKSLPVHTQANGGALLGIEPLVERLGIRVQLGLRFRSGSVTRRYGLPQSVHTRLAGPFLLAGQQELEDRLHLVDLGIQLLEELLLDNYMLRI